MTGTTENPSLTAPATPAFTATRRHVERHDETPHRVLESISA